MINKGLNFVDFVRFRPYLRTLSTISAAHKKVFWKYAANLQENTHAEVRFQWICFATLLKSHLGNGFLL